MLFLNYKPLKLSLRVYLVSNTVAMVTYCVTKMVTTCSPMVEQYFDIMIVASSDKEWLTTTHQNISAGNYFELPQSVSVLIPSRMLMSKNVSKDVSQDSRIFERKTEFSTGLLYLCIPWLRTCCPIRFPQRYPSTKLKQETMIIFCHQIKHNSQNS